MKNLKLKEGQMPMICQLCNHADEWYMLKHELWNKITETNHKNLLCRPCCVEILGRNLQPEDYHDCPLNDDLTSKTIFKRIVI